MTWTSRLPLMLLVLACGNDGGAWARSAPQGTPEQRAAAAARAGKYDEALTLYREATAAPNASVAARRGLVRTLRETGKYDEAEEIGRRFAAASPELSTVLGEVLYDRGKLAAAESAFVKGSHAASDSLTAQVMVASLLFERGERDEAMKRFDRFIDVYNNGRGRLTSGDLTAVGIACRYLGRDNGQLFKDALRAFDQAYAADTMLLEPRVRALEMLVDKFAFEEAATSVDELLRINPKLPRALLAGARRATTIGEPGAGDMARRALETNPNFADGRVFLASMALDSEEYAKAIEEAQRALAVNAESPTALAMIAAARYLQRDVAGFEEAKKRALARAPRDPAFFVTLANMSSRNRFYREAVTFAKQATELDAKAWVAWGVMGLNELRIGQPDSGKIHLDRAFKGDPYDPWVKNTLDLLDTFAGFRETRTARFRFFIAGKESDLLGLYAGELAEEAFDKLAARYDYRPPTPVRVEMYDSHADFSVRTVGLVGLGALGVAFGSTLAMDSPSAREGGEFNWGSTLWHELAHAFTLGMTDHRVPRWLSEGISVYEERRARQGWGADVTPDFLAAFKAEKLVPVSRMNDGFTRPTYPAQVIHSYYQASLVCELIERDFGARALIDMLRAYKDGLTTDQVFQRVLKVEPTGLDKRFEAYVQQRFGAVLDKIRPVEPPRRGGPGRAGGPGGAGGGMVVDQGEFSTAMREAVTAFDAGKKTEAEPLFEQAKKLFPEYAGGGSAYWYLAQIYKERGDIRKSAEELKVIVARNETSDDAHRELATMLVQLGDTAGAAQALDRLMYISPYEIPVHERLATLLARTGDRQRAVRERRAIVALGPVDAAEARYQLALAYFEAGDRDNARRELLRALEDAPNFEKAQQLLLRLRSTGGAPS